MEEQLRIIPGQCIGPFRVGEPAGPQEALLEGAGAVVLEQRGDMRLVHSRDVTLFIEDEVVTQVGIHDEHPGRTAEGLGLGVTLGEIDGVLLLDPVNEVLLLEGVEGLCFSTDEEREAVAEVEEGRPAVLPQAARISWIGVLPREIDSPEAVPVRLE